MVESGDFKERRYTPPELNQLLRQAGLDVEHIWGGTAGNWGRRKISLGEVALFFIFRT